MNIGTIHTDNLKAYNIVESKYNRTTTKDQTTQIESFNGVNRSFSSALKRKTKAFYKTDKELILRLTVMFRIYNNKKKQYLDNMFDHYIFKNFMFSKKKTK